MRAAEVAHVTSLLSSGTSVELVGTRFSGRSEVLRRARQALGELGFAVLSVNGVGQVPLEALRLALPPGTRRPAGAADSTSAVSGAVLEYLSEGPSIIVIDDAERLDDASWTIVESIHRSLKTPILAASLPPEMLSSHDHLLVKIASPAVKIALQPMTREELHDIIQDRLGEPVAPTVSARLHTKSAGLPGLALAQFESAVRHGRIRKNGSFWSDEGDLWTPDLDGAYEALLFDHGVEVREAVEALSLTGAVPVATAIDLIGQGMLERLEALQLAQLFMGDEQPLVAVTPPGLGVYFRHQRPTVRRMRILDSARTSIDGDVQIRAQLEELEPGAGDEGGSALLGTQVPVLARLFIDTYRVELAAARQAWLAHPVAVTASRYLWLQLSGDTDPEEVERVLERTPRGDEDAAAEVELRYLHARWLLHQEATLAEALEALQPPAGRPFELVEALELLRFSLTQEFEAIDPAYESKLVGAAAGDTFTAHIAAMVLATCHTLTGRADAAIAVLDGVQGTPSALAGVHFALCRSLALYASGRFGEAIDFAAQEAASASARLDRVSLVGHTYVRAASLVSLGRFADAYAAAGLVLATASQSVPLAFSPDRALLVVLAISAIRTGRESTATSLVEQSRHVGLRSLALPIGSPEWVEATLLVSEGDRGEAKRVFARLSDDLARRNYTLAANVAQLAAQMVGYDSAAADGFASAASAIGGELYPAFLESRAALSRGDAEQLLPVAERLHALGASSEALRLHAHAVRLFRERGDVDGANRARTAAKWIADATGDATWTLTHHADFGFTSREQEVVQFIAEGMSNADIAGRMFVSVRTVESHLRNIRRKTGAVDRGDIGGFAAARS